MPESVVVPRPSPVSSFDTLRSWNGSQARAFEELSYQLLKSRVPSGSEAVRTGNPDGGIEWYASLPTGSEWGWQAKHVHGIDALLTAMTSSVQRVVQDRPKLVKLTFVISWNLATSTRRGARLSQRQKFENKVASWNSTVPGAANVEFDLIQESDLLALLAQPEHRGRAWFWWADPVLGADWLAQRLAEQSAVAGERYRPDLQVDLPIEDDLRALGAADSVLAAFQSAQRRLIAAGREVRLTPTGPKDLVRLHKAILKSTDHLIAACSKLVFHAGSDASALAPLKKALSKFFSATFDAERGELGLEHEWRQRPPDDRDREREKPPAEARSYSVRELRNAASKLDAWLQSSVGQALQARTYFLVGPAGSGKTHVFVNAVERALANGRPAVVLFGARFGRADLWASICDQLGLPPLGADVLLGAMDAAGEAAAIEGRRFVLLIDALNDTLPPAFWVSHLPALRAAISPWPHVSLAVSCRDTYSDVVCEGTERSGYVTRTHPGFAGHEVEATQKYFHHYGLELPRIPLLVPEFSLPLFLRLYCESLRDSATTGTAVGHEGRVRIFERYLDVKLHRVARRLRPAAATAYEIARATSRASKVVDALIDEFATTGREGVRCERAEALATMATRGSADDAAIVLGALESEGILTRELLYLGDESTQDGFRVVFQAFSDYLILRRRLAAVAEPMQNSDLRQWLLEDCSTGIVEAAAVSLPELYHTELPDFLGIGPNSMEWPETNDLEAHRRASRARNVFRSVLTTLPYRDAKAVTKRTVDLLNQSHRLISPAELFRTMFLIAPQPGNRLNAHALHRYLQQFNMPRRDAFFGFATYGEISDEASPATTLARWAARGPYPTYDPEVVELSCIPLTWLLSSPNRFMRDWVTKAMVQLLRGHLDVARRLVNRFWKVDDPYVVQRVIVISYGALMRSDPAVRGEARKLAARIRKIAFARPVRADELMLDAARGVVEWGVAHKLLPKKALVDIKRPYGMAAPTNPPTEATLEKKYVLPENGSYGAGYSTIWFSLLSMGDFGRYVVESGMRNFSRYRHGQRFPERENAPKPLLVKSRWRAFEKTLSIAQRKELQRLSEKEGAAPDSPGPADPRPSDFWSSLSEPQLNLLRSVWREPTRQLWRSDEYPADRAKRWIFRRTLSLGWTPRLFGVEDRRIGYARGGREAHKAERWGKKYQWMAYHELLARVADNFQPARRWERSEPYEGLHQIVGEREIDPSLPPVDYRDFTERGAEGGPTWRRAPVRIVDWPPGQLDFSQFGGSIDRFLADTLSEPSLDRVAFVVDEQGETWFLLDGYIFQGDPSADKTWLGLQQPLALHSWLVSRDQAVMLLPHLPQLWRSGRWAFTDDHGHVDCCYAGEIGWTPRTCYYRHADFKAMDAADQRWQLVPAVETVTWEGSILDCSISASVFAAMPSTFIQAKTNLILDERGPSWRNAAGLVVFTNFGDQSVHRSKALLVRGSWLRTFLKENALELLVASWFERRLLDGDHRHPHPSQNVYAAARIDADLRLFLADQVREPRGGATLAPLGCP